MSRLAAGSFVTHDKLADLGSGEILSTDKGTMRIRFSSGEREFLIEAAEKHLVVTQEAPAPAPTTKAKKKSAAKKKKA